MNEDEERYVKSLLFEHAAALRRKDDIILDLREQLKCMKYAFKGAVGEHMTVSIELSRDVLPSKSELAIVDAIASRATQRLAHDVEERLGGRYELLVYRDKAERHINYLENHARACGVSFTPFSTLFENSDE